MSEAMPLSTRVEEWLGYAMLGTLGGNGMLWVILLIADVSTSTSNKLVVAGLVVFCLLWLLSIVLALLHIIYTSIRNRSVVHDMGEVLSGVWILLFLLAYWGLLLTFLAEGMWPLAILQVLLTGGSTHVARNGAGNRGG